MKPKAQKPGQTIPDYRNQASKPVERTQEVRPYRTSQEQDEREETTRLRQQAAEDMETK